MKVELVYIEGCPGWRVAEERLREALDLAGRDDVAIDLRRIADAHQIASLAFAGSPTILIDGVDAFGPVALVDDLSCRLYVTPKGLRGAPSTEQLAKVVREQLGE